ncbi:hypothetical protein V1639_11555 [Pseudarthrobacter sp. J75]|uniref:hypothetical protein n=1 Tax=unclassified Pseudarthrobacter TaxID=2647000 RepID=UPI002E8097AD|nr:MULTISPECIES: hypothetical protein [unclassified Pseudarthrobacter]MEE2522794.1 hypothetical protein [Pseudarthrobacter sp. J47]MEE2529655.1 hypothetical protein [Pseudarthrobacter sp. J75]
MTENTQAQPVKKTNWVARIIFGVVALVILVLAYFILAAFLPVWWATTIGNQVQGDLAAGVWVGMFYGFVFTLLPLMVAWQATRKQVSWPWKIVLILLGVALATPNLLTAAILISNSESAHNGQRILGTEATWFPIWTQISAVAAVVAFVAGVVLWKIWRHRGQKVKAFKKAEAERALAAKNAERDARSSSAGKPETRPASSDENADDPGKRH